MAEFYGEDLAAIHAEGFGQLAEAAAQEVLAFLGDRANGASVLDLGCGAGALAAVLAAAGAQVWGADISPALLAIARERVPQATFVQGSIHDLDLPQARAVCAVGEVVNYLADPRAGEGLGSFLGRVHAALEPGGLLLFDAAAPGRGGARGFTEGDGWAVGAISEETDGELLRHITTFRRHAGGGWRRAHETHRLKLLDPTHVLHALGEAGFAATATGAYGDLALPPGLIRYRAVRR